MSLRRRLALTIFALAAVGFVIQWFRHNGPLPPEVPVTLAPEAANELAHDRAEVLADRKSAPAWGQLGLRFTANGFDDESAACFREAHRLDPADQRWPYMLGIYHLTDLRDPALAMKFLETAFGCEHRSLRHEAAVRLRLAEAYLAEGRLNESERLFREQLARDPKDARAAVGLGLALLAAERPADAVPLLELAASSPQTRRKSATGLATAHRLLNDLAAAERLDQQAAKFPEDAPPLDPFIAAAAAMKTPTRDPFEEIAALEAAGRIADTIPVLQKLADDPANTRAALLLGRNLSTLGRAADAEPHLRRAASREPENAQAALFLGTTLFDLAVKEADGERRTKLLRESAESCARAAKLNPALAVAHYSQGMALKELGEVGNALPHFRLAVESRPEVPQFQLGLVQVLFEAGSHEEARARMPVVERVVPADHPQLTAIRKQLTKSP